jgi:hypothetical protein
VDEFGRAILDARDFVLLCNTLYEARVPLTVRAPLVGVPLFTYDARRASVVRGIGREAFLQARDRCLPYREALARDAPGWGDVRDALVGNGALPLGNASDFELALAREMANAAAPANPNPTHIGFDTNVLYLRLLSGPAGARLFPPAAPGIRYLLSDAVVSELDSAIGPKFSPADAADLKNRAAGGESVAGFVGRARRKGRRAKGALADAQYLLKELKALRWPADGLAADGETNDRVIAQSYARFRETRGDVVLVTGDHDMQQHALSAGLKVIFLQVPWPDSVPTGAMDERVLGGLVHDLAVAFGCLHLDGLGATVWGDWSGKTPGQWLSRAVRIEEFPSRALQRSLADLAQVRYVEEALRGRRRERAEPVEPRNADGTQLRPRSA